MRLLAFHYRGRNLTRQHRCNHDHVVRLKEVINDGASKKIFMVLEYAAGGQVVWRGDNQEPKMTVDEARRTFRDVVLGLEYLHFHGIIHRDIKPANLLWTSPDPLLRTVKISDFGVSHVTDAISQNGDVAALRRKTAGSPAFFAPELCYSQETPSVTPTSIGMPVTPDDDVTVRANGTYFRPEHGSQPASASASTSNLNRPPSARRRPSHQRNLTAISTPLTPAERNAAIKTRPPVNKAIDIWALGVTLYCLLFGVTPFIANNEYELFNLIPTREILLPEWMGADRKPVYPRLALTEDAAAEARETVDLLRGLLDKDPLKRISLHDVKNHPWVLRNLREDPATWLQETDVAIAAEDHADLGDDGGGGTGDGSSFGRRQAGEAEGRSNSCSRTRCERSWSQAHFPASRRDGTSYTSGHSDTSGQSHASAYPVWLWFWSRSVCTAA